MGTDWAPRRDSSLPKLLEEQGAQRVETRATVLGEDRSGVFFLSDLWRRRERAWRVWRRHSSPLTAAAIA